MTTVTIQSNKIVLNEVQDNSVLVELSSNLMEKTKQSFGQTNI